MEPYVEAWLDNWLPLPQTPAGCASQGYAGATDGLRPFSGARQVKREALCTVTAQAGDEAADLGPQNNACVSWKGIPVRPTERDSSSLQAVTPSMSLLELPKPDHLEVHGWSARVKTDP